MPWSCACCTRILPNRAIEHIAVTEEGDKVSVGSDCIKKIKEAGEAGFFHEKGTELLFSLAAYDTRDEQA